MRGTGAEVGSCPQATGPASNTCATAIALRSRRPLPLARNPAPQRSVRPARQGRRAASGRRGAGRLTDGQRRRQARLGVQDVVWRRQLARALPHQHPPRRELRRRDHWQRQKGDAGQLRGRGGGWGRFEGLDPSYPASRDAGCACVCGGGGGGAQKLAHHLAACRAAASPTPPAVLRPPPLSPAPTRRLSPS